MLFTYFGLLLGLLNLFVGGVNIIQGNGLGMMCVVIGVYLVCATLKDIFKG